MPETPAEALKTPAAADLLGVTADTLIKAADAGEIPCWKTPGGHRRFSRSALLALLEQRSTPEPIEQTA